MLQSVLLALSAGLQIWNHKLKHKYKDKLDALTKEWYEEYNKPDDIRSRANLDRIEFELRVLCRSFASEVGVADLGAGS